MTKPIFRKICLEQGLTSIETHLLIKLISDGKGPKKSKLDEYIRTQKSLLKEDLKKKNLLQENQDLIFAVQQFVKSNRIKLPLATYTCNT